MNRIVTLDYLRGIAAFGIMLFHYYGDIFGKLGPNDFLGKVGVYGVTIFYVLSGLTLYHVYHEKLTANIASIKKFFLKRVIRIHPLLILSTVLTLVIFKSFGNYNASTLFLNFTGLFGLLDWSNYITQGAWSIGNELVFYLFFPVFVLTFKFKKIIFYLFFLLLFSIYLYFTFYVIKPGVDTENIWHNYVNPLNQVFYFLGGFSIGAFFSKKYINPIVSYALLFAAVITFTLYPINGTDEALLFTGFNRIAFTLMCYTACLSLYKLNFTLPLIFDKPIRLLGEISYSVYLLHIVCLKLTQYGFAKAGLSSESWIFFFSAIAITIVVSYLVYTYYEMFFMRKGNQLIYKAEKR